MSTIFAIAITVCAASGSGFPFAFLTPDDLTEAQGVTLSAYAPDRIETLLPADPNSPALWYLPAAALSTPQGSSIWYLRADKTRANVAERRVICLGAMRDSGEWYLPPLSPESPPWGGENNIALRGADGLTEAGTKIQFSCFQVVYAQGRLRMLYAAPTSAGKAGLFLASSDNGTQWSPEPGGATLPLEAEGFSLLTLPSGESLFFQTKTEAWADKPYPDNLPHQRRVIGVRSSQDLHQWSDLAPLLRPDAQDPTGTEFFALKPFAYAGRYAALLLKYRADPAKPGRLSGLLTTELVTSDDARQWRRPFRDTDLGIWSYADPILDAKSLRFLIGRNHAIEAARYGLWRLTGVSAEEDGSFITPVFALPPAPLGIAVDARGGGYVDVEVLDAGKGPLGGGLSSCHLENVSSSRELLEWDGLDTTELTLDRCRLRIRMHHATVYGITVLDKPAS